MILPRFIACTLLSLPLSLQLGCAGGLPAVVSSNVDSVSIEFELEGSVAEAGELASEECEKHGKTADFSAVDQVAAPNSRIANFKCVDPAGEPDPTMDEK